MERLLARSKLRVLPAVLLSMGIWISPLAGDAGSSVAHAAAPGDADAAADAGATSPSPPESSREAPADLPPAPLALPTPAAVTAPATEPVVTEAAPPVALPARPKLGLALGMGLSWDSTGFVDRAYGRVPSFAVTAEARGAMWGVALSLLTTSASGRFPYKEIPPGGSSASSPADSPVDRLGFGARLTVRPFADRTAPGLLDALARELMVGAGPAFEHAAAGTASVGRFGIEGAASEDFVLYRDDEGSELRLRLIARRFWGSSRSLGMLTIADSAADVGLALAAVF